MMVAESPVGRAGTPDEFASVEPLPMGEPGAYTAGSDFLMDGGVTTSWRIGDLAPT